MFNSISNFFTGLASSAKTKIIEKTLQPLIDYHFENIFEQKIVVQDLNKGIKNVKLNANHLNSMLKINSIQTFTIQFIKLEKLQLEMRDIELVLDLNAYVQEEAVIESLEIEGMLQKSVVLQMNELRKEFLSEEEFLESEILQSNQPKNGKTSSTTVRILRFVDSIFGNIKVNLKNLNIKLIGQKKDKNEPTKLCFQFDQINTQMQKPENSSQIILTGNLNKLSIHLNDKYQLAEINNALQLEMYLKSDNEPKVKLHIDILQAIINQNQLEEIASLIFQGFQVIEERNNTINEAIRKSNSIGFIKSAQSKQNLQNSNKFNLKKFFQPNYYQNSQKKIAESSIIESIINVQYQNQIKIAEFNKSFKHMFEQKEFLFIDWEGINFNIAENQDNQDNDLSSFQCNFDYKSQLGNHYSINLAKLKIIKDQSINVFINSIYIYQILVQSLEFQSFKSSSKSEEKSGFFFLDQTRVLCKKILEISWQENLNQNNFQIRFQEPQLFFSSQKFTKAMKIDLQQGIKLEIRPFNLILNKDQLEFFWVLANLFKQKNPQVPKFDQEEKEQQKFQLAKTRFSIFYQVDQNLPFIEENVNDNYLQFDFEDFFVQDSSQQNSMSNSESQDKYKNLFEFGCSNIQGMNTQFQASDVAGYFGQLKKKAFIPKLNFDGQKSSILAYKKNSKKMLEQHLAIQIKEVKIKHDQFDNFYKMLSQFNSIFNKKDPKQIQQPQQNFYLQTKINKIIISLYKTLSLHAYKFQYYFTLNYQFILIDDIVSKMINQNYILLQNQLKENLFFSFYMKNSEININFAALKLNLMNFNFEEIKGCIIKFINSVQFAKPENKQQNNQQQQKLNIQFKCIILDMLPTYNEEIILKKKGLAKIEYQPKSYPSWTRSFMLINNLQISDTTYKVDEIEIFFTNKNSDQVNNQIFEINENYKKIGQIQDVQFSNKKINIKAIQFFSLGKQIVQDLFDHFQQIQKDFKKEDQKQNQQQLQQIKQFEVTDKIIEVDCEQINLHFESGNIQIVIFHTNFTMGKQSISLKMNSFQIQDLIKASKFKYILDEEEISMNNINLSQLLKKSPILDMIICYSQDSLAIKLELKPIRICLSGYQIQHIMKSFQIETIKGKTEFEEQDDDEHFEIIQKTQNFSLQVQLSPLQFIISYDSQGVELESLSKTFLKMSSFNNLILATNKILNFYQNNQTSKQDFVQFLINQQISTFNIIFQAYNSLEITQAASVFTNGIISILSKPFLSNNGFFYGLIEGSYDFTCGVTSSILQLTSLPANAINNLANLIGLGVISIPLAQLDEFCQKLYYKINPNRGIPERFLKTDKN